MSDLFTGLISAGGARLLEKRRDRARARALDRGGNLSAPCALRIVDGDKARWRHGRATADGDTVIWRPRTGRGHIVLRHGNVRLLTVRSPTARETWFIREALLIHRLSSDERLIDVALLPAEARYSREVLGLPTPCIAASAGSAGGTSPLAAHSVTSTGPFRRLLRLAEGCRRAGDHHACRKGQPDRGPMPANRSADPGAPGAG